MAIANPRVSAAVFCVCCGALTACGGEEVKYKPHPPVQGVKATLPPVPNVQKRPVKSGDAYTVWGAGYYLRSRVHHKDIAGTKITLAGYIIKTNISDAPECAVHKGGKADPEDCKPPIPAFWVADTREAPLEESIKVMGWASNYAQIYDAIADFDKGDETAEHMDTFWGIKTPNPLPSKGAKVRVKGTYSTTFSGASTGTEADPIMGLMAYQEIENVEPAPELVTLPGVKRKEPKTEGEPKKK
ncbi:MAG TPA: hypothetical protein VGJ84_14945 [Polyangiaceae bacterium]|jgi:hypothetical protein